LDWFIGLPDGHITSLDPFSTLFRGQFIVNRAPPPVSFDLFDVKQYQVEPLKDFLNRYGALVVKLHTKDEAMMVHAFKRRILSRPINDSLIRCRPKTFSEIRYRAFAHISEKEEVTVKHGSVGPIRPRERSRAQPIRVHEVATEKRSPARHAPYEPKKHQTRARAKRDMPCRHKFRVNVTQLIAIPDVADKLKPPLKSEKRLGLSRCP